MSLTSYRAAPSRVNQSPIPGSGTAETAKGGQRRPTIVNGFLFDLTPAAMPGDVLLFRGLSHSTIGAVRFHGRVRDGIGWGTDAMVTKQ